MAELAEALEGETAIEAMCAKIKRDVHQTPYAGIFGTLIKIIAAQQNQIDELSEAITTPRKAK